MLTDCVALPATDLWSLGCIIFRMHTGEYPFTAKGNQGLFQKILNLEFNWPAELRMSPNTKDLVASLLKISPADRLGSGKPGTENDISSLKRHAYFKGVQFETLEVQDVPSQSLERL